MITTILYKLNSKNISKGCFVDTMLILIQSLMSQSSHQLSITIKTKSSSLLILFIWILCSRILSLSFTSLMLRTFNTRSPSLTAETLEDIVSKRNLLVLGRRALNDINLYKPEIYDSLINRLKFYESKLGIVDNEDVRSLSKEPIIRDIVDRKAVLIVPTIFTVMIPSIFPGANLIASDTKYNSLIRYSYLSNGIAHHDIMIKL